MSSRSTRTNMEYIVTANVIIIFKLRSVQVQCGHLSYRTEHLHPPLTRAALKALPSPPVPTGTVRFSIRVTPDPLRFRTIWRLLSACHSGLRGLLELTFCAMVVDRVASCLLDVLAHISTAQGFTHFGRTRMYSLWMLLALLGPLLCIPISLVSDFHRWHCLM